MAVPIEAHTYEDIAATHNARVDRLDRIWSRAAVRLTWTGDDGKRRDEQGEGHFMYRRPSLGLSVGKLGETLVWLGFDSRFYWLIDRHETEAMYLGRHQAITRERAASLGLPAYPHELIILLGLAELPAFASTDTPPELGLGVGTVSFDLAHPELLTWRFTFDAESLLPVQIELLDQAGAAIITSALSRTKDVRIDTGERPMLQSLVEMVHHPSGTELLVSLRGDPTDGFSGARDRLEDRVFDPAHLADAYGPLDILDLDHAPQ